jgi:hypothetical protein
MSKCTFSIGFNGTPEALVSRAQAAVEKQGGTFSGDVRSGQFSLQVFGTITGRYAVNGQELEINIEDKPMMIPCGAIEQALRNQLGG